MKREMIIILWVFVSLTACSETTEVIQISTSEETNTADQRTAPTEIYSVPTLTVSPSPTMSEKLTPTLVSESTNAITMTPLPTLSAEEAEYTFRQWLLGSEDCQLPCWAGVIPGETTWEEAKDLVAPVLEITNEFIDSNCFDDACSGFSWKFPSQDVTGPVYGSILEVNQDFVTKLAIRIFSQELQIPIDQFFTIYGLPERILVFAGYLDELWGDTPDEIILYYPEYDFVVRYFRSGWQSGGNRWSCGSFEVYELEITYNMETNLNNHDILVLLEGEKDYYVTYPDLEEVTDFTIESFAEMFIDNPNACFEIITNY